MGGCSEGCKEEFKTSNFLLTHERPDRFVTSQWSNCGCSTIFYLVWRTLAAIAFIAMLTLSAVNYNGSGEGPLWFIYLTNWSFFFLTLDTVIQFALAWYAFSLYRKGAVWEKLFPAMPWYLKMEWVITNVASCAGLLVTILYWGLLYRGGAISYNNFNVHALNSIYIVINLYITALPVRIYHLFHGWIYAVAYVIFSAIYTVGANQEPIYNLLDWSGSPGTAAAYGVSLSIFGTLVIWLVYYGLYRLRVLIFDRMDKGKRQVHPEQPPSGSEEQGHDNPAYQP